jgi:hypothetical protein
MLWKVHKRRQYRQISRVQSAFEALPAFSPGRKRDEITNSCEGTKAALSS